MKLKVMSFVVLLALVSGACSVVPTAGETQVSAQDAVAAWQPPAVMPIQDCQTMAWIDLYLALPTEGGYVAYPTWRGVGPFAPATVLHESEKIADNYAKAADEMWVPEGINLDPCTAEGCPGDAFVWWDEIAREMPDCPLDGKPEEDVLAMEVGSTFLAVDKRMYVVPLLDDAVLERFDGTIMYFAGGGEMKLAALLEGMRVESGLQFIPGKTP